MLSVRLLYDRQKQKEVKVRVTTYLLLRFERASVQCLASFVKSRSACLREGVSGPCLFYEPYLC